MKTLSVSELLKERLAKTTSLLLALASRKGLVEKIAFLDRLSPVSQFFEHRAHPVVQGVERLDLESIYVVKATIALGQGDRLFALSEEDREGLTATVEQLLAVERFYSELGGIIGYQQKVYELLLDREQVHRHGMLIPPVGISLEREDVALRRAVLCGIESLSQLAEVYPIGGAADRLRLRDAVTSESLPAAKLLFGGRELLEGLVRDVQGREYLYYKLYGKQVTVPIIMMTSSARRGSLHIEKICKKSGWFGRDPKTIFLLSQPSVPTVTEEGDWCISGPLALKVRPGGHGVIWKLLASEGCFSRLQEQGKKTLLLRQINNPIAGIDNGLLAFVGIGVKQGKKFGFASCPRVVHSHEGMNVVKVNGNTLSLSNVEYCEFQARGIEDRPYKEGGNTSQFPSNTNILFADIASVQKKIAQNPFPGLILNFRNHGRQIVARLESLMQNISDSFVERFLPPLSADRQLEMATYVTFNARHKTISAVKKEYAYDGNILETPEGCYFDFLRNMHELLQDHCGMRIPPLPTQEAFLEHGPTLICHYHPALGPLYAVIAQKIRGGCLHQGSELSLEIAECELEALDIAGSLVVHAANIMGHKDSSGVIRYSDNSGKCILRNVTVRNKGIDWGKAASNFWKHGHERKEALTIDIEGNGEFVAENITFTGSYAITVPSGVRMTAQQKGSSLTFVEEAITSSKPLWQYAVDDQSAIVLTKESSQ